MPGTRREFLVTGGTILSAGIVGSATATGSELPESDHVDDVGDDIGLLEAYQPSYITNGAVPDMIGIYGWWADNDDLNERAYYYWTRYSHQDTFWSDIGVPGSATMSESSLLSFDDHLYDHEPSIIFTDQDSGEVLRSVVTGYHHYAAERSAEDMVILEQRSDQPTHVGLDIVRPWNNYNFATESNEEDLQFVDNRVEIRSFLDARDEWVDSGIFDSTSLRAVDDPWVMDDRDSWWRSTTRDAQFAWVWATMGLRGASESPDLRIEGGD